MFEKEIQSIPCQDQETQICSICEDNHGGEYRSDDAKSDLRLFQRRSSVLVVIPTYNERNNLPSLLEALLALEEPLHILVVDDNSPDGTGQWVQEESIRNPNIHVLSRSQKNGLGRAYIAGFQWALERDYEIIIQMDADFSHNPKDLPFLIAPIKSKQADFSLGSRYIYGVRVINWPLRRLILSVGASYYVHAITGMPIHDPTGGFKCWHRKTLENIKMETIQSNGYGFQIEMSHRAWRRGFRFFEVPITFTDRFQGASKMSMTIVYEAFFMVWKLLFQNGCHRTPQKLT